VMQRLESGQVDLTALLPDRKPIPHCSSKTRLPGLVPRAWNS
jgi:hypothetical protein